MVSIRTWGPAAVVGRDQVDAFEQLARKLVHVVGLGQAARQARQHHVVGRGPTAVHHRAGHGAPSLWLSASEAPSSVVSGWNCSPIYVELSYGSSARVAGAKR